MVAPGAGGTFFSSPVYGTTPLPVNTWSHIALTYDKVTLRLYVNGTQVAQRRSERQYRHLRQPAADRRRQHLRAILQRPHR